jgi:hypothetical protein
MAGRRLVLVACIAASGCNAIFGLDSTELAPPDRDNDGDGIVNSEDNCVLVANADQADGDGDELGNACDPCVDADTQTGLDVDGDGVDDGCDSCPNGRNHDEDGDGFGDGCDDCPGVADPTQSDGDGDGIGDACDANASAQHRVFFDGFGPPDAAWNAGFKPWKSTTDGYVPATPMVGAGSYDEGPWHPRGVVTGSGIRVAVSVNVPSPQSVVYEQRIGISLRDYLNGAPNASCELRVEQMAWVRVGDTSSATVPTGRTRFELAFVPSATAGRSTTTCTIADMTVVPTTQYNSTDHHVPSLVANVAAEFEWIDILE